MTGSDPKSAHIVSSYDEDLAALQARVAEMGGLAEAMLADAIEALRKRDVERCREVVARDKRLDELEAEIEARAIRIIALRAPVAFDLRLVVACMRMSSTLERVGDLAKNVAKRGIDLAAAGPLPMMGSIARMGEAARRQLSEALDAFVSRDSELALSVWRRDVEIDELYESLFREVVTYMMEDPRTITLGSHCMFIAKNLERVGDHATHVAELAYYVVEGEPLDGERPRGPASDAPTG
ncbi:phosphate signaling complex protein PhoU [Oceanicella actignis]|uniref:Phosphate-specific transport system accessory protein PhoU n=1 Tax=Oceanicella actignis TaxID=1189325 RepID=A0A1M7SRX5_9RHOB|nr:phosphate signaling complex protein PhoU [Oceanicella actignis]SES67983.1 phosphate transport system protein [Oceanicella actignis]SHN61116.1 phosphate transport system protein [Oceanicella actignis]